MGGVWGTGVLTPPGPPPPPPSLSGDHGTGARALARAAGRSPRCGPSDPVSVSRDVARALVLLLTCQLGLEGREGHSRWVASTREDVATVSLLAADHYPVMNRPGARAVGARWGDHPAHPRPECGSVGVSCSLMLALLAPQSFIINLPTGREGCSGAGKKSVGLADPDPSSTCQQWRTTLERMGVRDRKGEGEQLTGLQGGCGLLSLQCGDTPPPHTRPEPNPIPSDGLLAGMAPDPLWGESVRQITSIATNASTSP